MKKAVLALLISLFILVTGFAFLLAQSGPENAPQDVQITDLPDTYEK